MIVKLTFYNLFCLNFLFTELLYSIKKIRKNKVVEVQRSDLVGQYLGSTTEKKQG